MRLRVFFMMKHVRWMFSWESCSSARMFFPDFFSKWSFYDRPFFYFKVSSDLKLDVASCVFFLKNKEKSMSTSVEWWVASRMNRTHWAFTLHLHLYAQQHEAHKLSDVSFSSHVFLLLLHHTAVFTLPAPPLKDLFIALLLFIRQDNTFIFLLFLFHRLCAYSRSQNKNK